MERLVLRFACQKSTQRGHIGLGREREGWSLARDWHAGQVAFRGSRPKCDRAPSRDSSLPARIPEVVEKITHIRLELNPTTVLWKIRAMESRQHLLDVYRAATQREEELFDLVKGNVPGQPGHDRAIWDQWIAALSVTTRASKELREAFTGDPG